MVNAERWTLPRNAQLNGSPYIITEYFYANDFERRPSTSLSRRLSQNATFVIAFAMATGRLQRPKIGIWQRFDRVVLQ